MYILYVENYKFPDIFFVDKVVPKKVCWIITASENKSSARYFYLPLKVDLLL